MLEIHEEIVGRVVGMPGGVNESDLVRQLVIAEKTGDAPAGSVDVVGPIQIRVSRGGRIVLSAERVREDAFAGCCPGKAGLGQHGGGGIRYAPLRRPAAARGNPEGV